MRALQDVWIYFGEYPRPTYGPRAAVLAQTCLFRTFTHSSLWHFFKYELFSDHNPLLLDNHEAWSS